MLNRLLASDDTRPAVYWRGRWLSYRDLRRRAGQLAARLHEWGVRKHDRVSILALNHIAHVDLMLAASQLGFFYTPLNYRLADAEQRALCDYVTPSLVFHDSVHADQAAQTGRPLFALDGYEDWLADAPSPPAAAVLGDDDIHMLLFTGGSTGVPKAAMIPYRQILQNARATAQGWGLTAEHGAIQATPCFHAALNVFTTPLLHLGGRVVLLENFEPESYLATTEQLGMTHWFLVPTMYQMLAAHPRFASARVSSVQWAISGGAPCPAPVRAAFATRGIRFKQGYGMTEAGVNCFEMTLDEVEAHPDAVGRPLPGLQAVIRAPDGRPVARGTVGELTLAGPQVCAGYYRREKETAESIRDGWLWTGDLARENEQGLFAIAGRRKEMFISGGENVFPVEIETVLYQLEGIVEAAVCGIPHPRWGEVGVAAVATKPGATWNAETLKRELKQRLAGYKVPQRYLLLSSLPKTGAGKINKPELQRLAQQEQAA